jgi:hypothetical protein
MLAVTLEGQGAVQPSVKLYMHVQLYASPSKLAGDVCYIATYNMSVLASSMWDRGTVVELFELSMHLGRLCLSDTNISHVSHSQLYSGSGCRVNWFELHELFPSGGMWR